MANNFNVIEMNIGAIRAGMEALPGLVAHRVQGFGLQAAANVVAGRARLLVPVARQSRRVRGETIQPGSLRRSIRASRTAARVAGLRRKIPGAAGVLIAGGPRARHVNLIEYGFTARNGRHIPGTAFLEKALLTTTNEQVKAFGIGATRALVRVARQIREDTAPATIRRLAAEG